MENILPRFKKKSIKLNGKEVGQEEEKWRLINA
jgi:hypothetical protein